MNAHFLKILEGSKEVQQTAAHTRKFGNDNRVTSPEVFNQFVPAWTVLGGSADRVGDDLYAACLCQLVKLAVYILLLCAYPRVSILSPIEYPPYQF
jgi:hypothetical protein